MSAGFRNPFGIGLVGSGFHSFRWAFALALQKLILLVGLTTGVSFLGCFPEFIWQLPVLAWLSSALLFPWNSRCPLAVSCKALFPLLSCFRYICLNLDLRKVNPCHRYTPRTLSASTLPAPHQSLPDQESVPQIYSAKAQRFTPSCSAPVPPQPGIHATDIIRESSALPAFLLRNSPSPTRNPWYRYTPRKLSAPGRAQTRVPSISPLTRGDYISFPLCNFWRESFDVRLYVQSRSNWVTFLPTSSVLSMTL